MRPAARIQAAIELLDSILAAAREAGPAADTVIGRYFAERRYAGSGDRRAVRDLVYRAVRRSGERPESGRAAMLGLAEADPQLLPLFDGSPHAPSLPGPEEKGAPASPAPSWLDARWDPLIDQPELAALLERAPLDLRVNRLRGDMEEARGALPEASPTPHSLLGLRLPDGYRVEETAAWRTGLVEVQDEGSQLVALACGAESGMLAVDLCAGAGGKSLALAAEMANQGRIVATDSDRGRLARIQPRLLRANVSIVETRLLDPGREMEGLGDVVGQADLVLVDAPCSGTGTWRRNPETRWRLTPDRLERLVILQSALLDIARQLVRPGGYLIYAVCSLLAEEGRNRAAALTAGSSLVTDGPAIGAGRAAGTGRLLTPAHDGTDGFFVARWRASC